MMTDLQKRPTIVHELKCEGSVFHAVATGHQKALVRLADRDYQVGDILYLHRVVFRRNNKQILTTGETLWSRITHILSAGNTVVLSMEKLAPPQPYR